MLRLHEVCAHMPPEGPRRNSIKLGILEKKLTKVCSSDKAAEFFF